MSCHGDVQKNWFAYNGWGMASTAPVRAQGILIVFVINFLVIDECAMGTHNCHRDSNATCKDTDDSFTCTCSEGFDGNGTFCEGTLYIGNFSVFSEC